MRPLGKMDLKVSFLFVNYTLLFREIRAYSSLSTNFFLVKHRLAVIKLHPTFSRNMHLQLPKHDFRSRKT